jgi:hypothetical protein
VNAERIRCGYQATFGNLGGGHDMRLRPRHVGGARSDTRGRATGSGDAASFCGGIFSLSTVWAGAGAGWGEVCAVGSDFRSSEVEEAIADTEETVLTGWWRKHGDQTDPDMRRALMWADRLDLPDDTMMLRAIYAAWAAECQMDDPDSRERA